MLTPDNCIFYKNNNGFLCAKIDGNDVGRVKLIRTMPLTKPDYYIAVDDIENKEFGIIENINNFGGEQKELIEGDLALRYFCPVIDEITSVKEKMGNFYFEVNISNVKKSFAVRDISHNVRRLMKDVLIIDVDGNRYRVLDIDTRKDKTRRRLEPYLY